MPDERHRESDDPVPAEVDEASEPAGAPVPDAAPNADAPASKGLAEAVETPTAAAAEAFHQRARLAEDRLEEVLAAYRQLKGENEQHKERVTRNIERRFGERREQLVLRFIDILDNLDRALEHSERSYATESLIDGLIMVRTQLLQTLQDEGLERIPVLGLPFDPQTSEAVATRPVDDAGHHDLVVAEELRGYRFEGRLVRASRVVVGEFTEAEAEKAPKPSDSVPADPAEAAPDEPEADTSIEDIVSRVQAQEALFPDAFEDEDDEEIPVEEKDPSSS